MTVQIPGMEVPAGAELTVRIELTARVNVTAYVARQAVARFVIAEISSQLLTEPPTLHVGERLCWSVPVALTSPGRGAIGRVGEIRVDATTGEILADAETVARMTDDAQHLAQRSPL